MKHTNRQTKALVDAEQEDQKIANIWIEIEVHQGPHGPDQKKYTQTNVTQVWYVFKGYFDKSRCSYHAGQIVRYSEEHQVLSRHGAKCCSV